MEYRNHKRKSTDLEISFSGEHVVGKGTLRDISPAGCGVASQQKVQVGSFLEALIHFPGGQDAVKIDVAVVRYCIPDRFGLDFLHVTPAEQQRLKQLLNSL